MEESNREHVTSDIGEAAYLKMLGFPITFDRTNPERVVICFKGDAEFIAMKAMDYYSFRANVDAKNYFDSLRQVKKAILEGRPRPIYSYEQKNVADGASTSGIKVS